MTTRNSWKRSILVVAFILAAAGAVQAQTVYFTAHGKVYHRYIHWKHKPGSVLEAQRAVAEAHGLRPCGFCWRTSKAKAKAPGNAAWAAPDVTPDAKEQPKPEKK